MRREIVGTVVACALWASLGAGTGSAATTAAVPLPLCCIPSGAVHAVAVDGNIAYVGGSFLHLGLPRDHLAVLDPASGQPGAGWPGVDGGRVTASAPDGSGGWYLAGTFTSVGGRARDGLAHLRADKSVDPAWAPTTNGTVDAIARDTAGTVYVGGSFQQVNAEPRGNLAALDAAGRVTAFTAHTDGAVSALATSFRFGGSPPSLTTVARLYVGGSFTHVAGTARHFFASIDLSNGALVGSDPSLNGAVTAIAVSGGGARTPRVAYVSGSFTSITSISLDRFHFAAFQEDGSSATSWAPSADGAATAITPSGSAIYIGGRFQHVDGQARTGLAAVDDNAGAIQSWNPDVEAPGGPPFLAIDGIAVSNGAVYAGGRFASVNGKPRDNLAAVDATTGTSTLDWDPDAPGFNPGVTHLAFDGSSLLVAGGFGVIGGPARSNLAAIDLSTGHVTAFDPQPDGEVDALALRGSTLYVGGRFTHVGSSARSGAAAIDTRSGQPTGFAPTVSNGGSPVAVRTLALGDSTAFVAGDFTQVGAASRTGLAAVDAQTGAVTPFHADADGLVSALAYKDGVLYAGGTFSHVGGAARHGFAALLASRDGQVSPFDPQFDGFTSSLLIHGNTLYVGGSFQHGPGGLPRVGMAALDLGSFALLPFNPTVETDPVALADDGTELFAAGPTITFISGAAHTAAGAIDFASGLAEPWAPSFVAGAEPNAVAVSRTAGLVVGGDATFTSGQGVLSALAIAPSTPAAPHATPGVGQATVAFTPPASGGAPVSRYRVVAQPGGATATGRQSPIVVGGLSPGATYTFTVSAANAAGQGPASPASNPVVVTAATRTPTPAPRPGAATLRASAFKVTHRRFAVAKAKTALVSKRIPRGTKFTFVLSAAARSQIKIARRLRGAKKGKRCVAPRKGLHKRCTRWKAVGALTRRHTKAGRNAVRFTGRLGRRALKPGTYRATLVATDAAGRRSKPVRRTFVVVRARKTR